MNKVALFDFCETLANFQTADAFVHFVREKNGNSQMQRKETFRQFLIKTKLLYVISGLLKHRSINKRLILWQLRGLKNDAIENFAEQYYREMIIPNLIPCVVEELKKLKNDGWRVVIVSAGYETYLKYFTADFGIPLEDLISVRIKFKNGICKGVFDGGDRLWDKTDILNEKFKKNEIISIAYSDSITDLPLLQWANTGVVVRRRDKQEWARKYNLKEIVWEK